ncbi:molybdate ABC transporter substrate-binding protein [Pseudalkalibacillus berkeleyi]|uniref:Molybdate ABC transporter substrate-binding protein n=1 Tax=Pseudalkalibacillus berkeleyi TaxID=1069813 RepID=A0ABS9GXE8_9BACL|nr:molybdate ABC transporter substrate-binding protein [Pseudalkalibacillus berkeleyi]MCF6136365.1 molybdate ABC transporter substrate-binding protein [Pseudalkalibacillus berkeleyi]
MALGWIRCLMLIFMILILSGCGSSNNDREDQVELHVQAASSLSDVMLEVERNFEKMNPSIDIVLNVASSGTLQRQIEQGAPADLFLSASETKFKSLGENGLIHTNYSKNLLQNELVVITGKKRSIAINNLDDLENNKIERISIGVPESVPAGQYAKETLLETGSWSRLQSKFVYAKDVRQVLSYVETGNVQIGFVYATDAKQSNKVKTLHKIQSNLHTNIHYPVGILKQTQHLKEAKLFYNYLFSKDANAIYTNYGFMPVN